MTARQLAERKGVELFWLDNEPTLIIEVEHGGELYELQTHNGKEALDMFYHPFVYQRQMIHRPLLLEKVEWEDRTKEPTWL